MTVKVKLLASMASPEKAWGVGDEYETSAEEAHALIVAGRAEPIGHLKVEDAVASPSKVEKRGKAVPMAKQ